MNSSTFSLYPKNVYTCRPKFFQLIIPGSTRNLGFFWIPVNERLWFAFAGMTRFIVINDAVYKPRKHKKEKTRKKRKLSFVV
jgi:hypothetical protein